MRELHQRETVGLVQVLVRAHVEHFRKAGMRHRAVVALEVVLDRDLPVARDLPVVADADAEPVEVDAALRDLVGERPERLRERPASRSADEDERPQASIATGSIEKPSLSKSGSRSSAAPLRSVPSRSYVQAWYGHWSAMRLPSPCAIR